MDIHVHDILAPLFLPCLIHLGFDDSTILGIRRKRLHFAKDQQLTKANDIYQGHI
jgi:hypothetical protein